jgi:hypothetical protein
LVSTAAGLLLLPLPLQLVQAQQQAVEQQLVALVA